MTPAIRLLQKNKMLYEVHEYSHDPAHTSYGLEAAEKMGVPAEQVFKTLVVSVTGCHYTQAGSDQTYKGSLMVAVIPVAAMLNTKAFAKAAQVKKAEMADPVAVQRSTGYRLGGVSPLGQKKALPTFIDISAKSMDHFYISAGRRGLEVSLSPSDVVLLSRGVYAELSE